MTVTEITEMETAPAIAGVEERIAALEARLAADEESQPEDRVSMVVFSGDLDKVLAAFVIATGAAAVGQQVSMFFTFWGLTALKKRSTLSGKRFFEKMMSVMTPSGSTGLPVSKMNYFGVGAKMLRKMMADNGVASLEEMMALARELGVKIVACEMSREVMGIHDDELVDGWETGGVASFLGDALTSKASLFI